MAVYLCPAYQSGFLDAGGGSNGKFDYTAFIVFSGARISLVKLRAQFAYASGPLTGTTAFDVFTPIICEEEPALGLNGGNVEGGHCNSDRIGHYHRGGGYYTSIDGSVHWFNEPMGCNSWNWYSQAPSGKIITLGTVPNPGWGYWNRQ
jgi:hypothetical protein